MGVDWLIMRPKNDCPQKHLTALIGQQANSLVAYGGVLYEELSATLPTQTDLERQQSLQHYLKSSQQLKACLDIIKTDRNELSPSHHVSVVSANPIFPVEWRINANRTFLPDEVPDIFDQWKSYVEAIQGGGYRAFLLDLFLYLTSRNLRDLWEELQFMAARTIQKNNAFTKKHKFRVVHGRLVAFAPPPEHLAPPWANTETQDQSIDVESDSRYQALMLYQQNIELLRRDWKYSVPSNMKPRRFKPQSFDDHLQYANPSWFEGFFEWLEECCQRGYGLYLDS